MNAFMNRLYLYQLERILQSWVYGNNVQTIDLIID